MIIVLLSARTILEKKDSSWKHFSQDIKSKSRRITLVRKMFKTDSIKNTSLELPVSDLSNEESTQTSSRRLLPHQESCALEHLVKNYLTI